MRALAYKSRLTNYKNAIITTNLAEMPSNISEWVSICGELDRKCRS